MRTFYWKVLAVTVKGFWGVARSFVFFVTLLVALWRYFVNPAIRPPFNLDLVLLICVAVAIVWSFLRNSYLLYETEKMRADDLQARVNSKLNITYDAHDLSCKAVVGFTDGTSSTVFRLRIANTGITPLRHCEGWLSEIEGHRNISPVRLFWVASPTAAMSVDVIKGIPRYLQICRITQTNEVKMATEGEMWPFDSLRMFVPSKYKFKIAVKGQDEAETDMYIVELNWTGDWRTANMAHP
jgi:hypothetical protein